MLSKLIESFRRPADFIIGEPENPYLLRWYIIPMNRFFNIYLHNFQRSDDDRALHDHPWWNISLLLKGEYREIMPGNESRIMRVSDIAVRAATAAHRIELINGQPTWSLFFTGPRIRQWGFHCPHGWRHWKEFVSTRDGGNAVGRGCE